jgi:hypothetical protein
MNKTKEDIMQEMQNAIADTELLKSLLRVGVQRSSDQDDVIKRNTKLDNIEEYLYMTDSFTDDDDVPASARCKLNPAMQLEDLEHLWEIAEANTFAETKIEFMFNILSKAMGTDVELNEAVMNADNPMYVVSNTRAHLGAAAILDTEALHKFGEAHNISKIIAIPSSIHEFIILPMNDDIDMENIKSIINDVNQEMVSPDEQLGDHAYILDI